MYTDKSSFCQSNTMPSAKHIPDPPTRPFTEYHVFSQLERNYILQTASDDQREITRDFRGIDDDAALRPARYQGIILPKNWQRKGMCRTASQVPPPRPTSPDLTSSLASLPTKQAAGLRRDHKEVLMASYRFWNLLSKLISTRWKEADIETR